MSSATLSSSPSASSTIDEQLRLRITEELAGSHQGGSIGDVAEADTAFSNRGYLLWLNFAMRWDDPAKDPDYIARTRKIVADLAPWTGKGVYVNMLNFDEMDRVVEAFGGPEKYARLGRVKAQYDPENFFRMNNNITPVA